MKVASQAEMAIQKALAGRLAEFTSSAPVVHSSPSSISILFYKNEFISLASSNSPQATIFVGTFNAGAQDPGYESLSEWLDTTLKSIEKADVSTQIIPRKQNKKKESKKKYIKRRKRVTILDFKYR